MSKKPLIFLCYFLALTVFSLLSTQALADTVYVMSTGNATGDTSLMNTLSAHGHTPTLGVEKQDFDGSQPISAYSVVMLTDSYNWNLGGMPNSGQTALLNYVNNGGGLITSEWVLWAGGQFGIIAAAFPALYDGYYNHASSTTYTKNVPDSIMNDSLPDSFTFPLTDLAGTESRVVANTGAIVFYNTSNFGGGFVGVAGWDYGAGRVINFSTLMAANELSNADYQQLVSNAVNWAGQGIVVPLPGAWLLLASGLFGLGLVRRR